VSGGGLGYFCASFGSLGCYHGSLGVYRAIYDSGQKANHSQQTQASLYFSPYHRLLSGIRHADLLAIIGVVMSLGAVAVWGVTWGIWHLTAPRCLGRGLALLLIGLSACAMWWIIVLSV